MADQLREFNLNARDWTTEDSSFVPADGDIWYYESHPDYDGIVHVIGDGSNTFDDLTVYADTWQGGVILTPGRKAMDELVSSFTSTGWVTVAETDSGNTIESISGRFTASSQGNGENIVIDYNVRPDTSSMTHSRSSIKIESVTHASSSGPTIFTGARFAYNSATSGVKLQIKVDASPTTLTTNISNNVTRLSSYKGLRLVTPTTTDNDKTPDGSTASFLVAGSERRLGFMSSGATCSPVCFANILSSDSVRLSIKWDGIPYPAATDIDFTGDFTDNFIIAVAGSRTSNVSASSGTFTNVEIEGDIVHCVFTKSGAFSGLDVFDGGYFLTQSSGFKAILS